MNARTMRPTRGMLRRYVRRSGDTLTLSAPLYIGALALVAEHTGASVHAPAVTVPLMALLVGLAAGWLVALTSWRCRTRR